jgi:hypothetical protein
MMTNIVCVDFGETIARSRSSFRLQGAGNWPSIAPLLTQPCLRATGGGLRRSYETDRSDAKVQVTKSTLEALAAAASIS